MATIDPRLVPLIETLINTGTDWLAFEILDGIRSGRPSISSEEEVLAARDAVWSFRKGHAPPKLESLEMNAPPLSGDDQIKFAEEYTIDRISQSIAMADASLQQLNRIANQGSEPASTSESNARSGVELRWVDNPDALTTSQVEETLKKLPALRSALAEWSNAVRQKDAAE